MRPLLPAAAKARRRKSHAGTVSEVEHRKLICLLYVRVLLKAFSTKFPLRRKTVGGMAKFWAVERAVLRRILSEFGSARREEAVAVDAEAAADAAAAGGADAEPSFTFERTRGNRDRLLMFALALWLYVHDGCVTQPHNTAMAAALKLTPASLNKYFRELGCKIERVKKSGAAAEEAEADGGGQQGRGEAVLDLGGPIACSHMDINVTVDELALGAPRVRRLHYVALHQENLTFAGARPAGLYPDPLLDPDASDGSVSRFLLADDGGAPRVFWLSLRVPRGAPAGDHSVAVRAAVPGGCAAAATATVRVAAFAMPARLSQLTSAQFAPREQNGSTVSNTTALAHFESLAAQGVNSFAWFELDSLPWAPTYVFDSTMTSVSIDGAAHREWWPRVLALPGVGGAPWRLPFSSRLPKAWGALPHLLPDNATWVFLRASNASSQGGGGGGGPMRSSPEEVRVPIFDAAAPRCADGATALNPQFARLFTLLFGAVARYVRGAAAAGGWPGGAEAGMWVQVADEPTWTDEPTARNMLALMQQYRRADPAIRIYQTRFPQGPGPAEPGRNLSAPMRGVVELVDWWCCHVCQAVDPAAYPWLRALRRERAGASPPRVFHTTVYDNGVPIIEAPWERVRSQALDVFNSNGTVDGTLSWYSVNSYGAPAHNPWADPYPTRTSASGNPRAIKDPAGWGYLLWPPPPAPAPVRPGWRPLESVRWLMVGAGLADAEHASALSALARRAARAGAPSAAAAALLARTRAFAARWPAAWNTQCAAPAAATVPAAVAAANFSDDGYLVDGGAEVDGSSVINEWRLATAAEIDRLQLAFP
eukprot:g7028.t1